MVHAPRGKRKSRRQKGKNNIDNDNHNDDDSPSFDRRSSFFVGVRAFGFGVFCTTLLSSFREARVLNSLKETGFTIESLSVESLSLSSVTMATESVSSYVRDALLTSANASTTNSTRALTTKEESTPQKTKRLCTIPETKFGEWRKVILPKAPFAPAHSKCYSQEELHSATKWVDYHWHPFPSILTSDKTSGDDEACDFEPNFTNDMYCRLAHNKTIGFMGDSLTWENFATLASRLGRIVGDHATLTFTSDDGKRYNQNEGIVMEVCNGTSKIAFMRHRYLLMLDTFLNLANPDVVVLNTGAHGRSDGQIVDGYSNRAGVSGAKWHIDVLAAHQERKRVQEQRPFWAIWRTTSAGHYNCSAYKEPVNNYTQMEAYVQSTGTISYQLRQYGWHNFQHQNNLILEEFQNYNQRQNAAQKPLLNFEPMHAYEVNLLRPDGHVGSHIEAAGDCLHNCDPGPADVYNVLLLHSMRLHEHDALPTNTER